MHHRFFRILLLVVSFLGSVVERSHAAVVLSVDFDALTSGIQSSLTATSGQTIAADIVLSLTETTSLSAFQFSVMFDRTELTFVSRSESFPAGFGFVETDTTNTNNLGISGTQGLLFRFGGDTGAGPVAPAGPFVVASLAFTASQPTGAATDIDIVPMRLTSEGDDFLVNGTFAVIPTAQLVFNGGSVTAAIPEPSTMGLVMAGFAVASTGIRRRVK